MDAKKKKDYVRWNFINMMKYLQKIIVLLYIINRKNILQNDNNYNLKIIPERPKFNFHKFLFVVSILKT